MSFVVTCVQWAEGVLQADLIGDEEECALRDHLLAAHAKKVQPGTLGVLVKHLVVTDPPPKRDKLKLALRDPVWVGPWVGGAATPLKARLLSAPYPAVLPPVRAVSVTGPIRLPSKAAGSLRTLKNLQI